MRLRNPLIWIFLSGMLVYFFMILPQISRPICGWEAMLYHSCSNIVTRGYKALENFELSPLLYINLPLALLVFGISEASIRIPGVLCFVVTTLMVMCLAFRLAASERRRAAAGWAGIFLMTSPLALQGSLVIDAGDSTVFMCAMVLFCVVLVYSEGMRTGKRMLFLAAVLCLCLWAKITTALAIPAALFVSNLLRREGKKGLLFSAGVTISGAAIFLITWFIYTNLFVKPEAFYWPFHYLLGNAQASFLSSGHKISLPVADLFSAMTWFSPYLLSLVAGGAFFCYANRQRYAAFTFPFTLFLLVFVGYLIVHKLTTCGFPKYLVPALPLMCVTAGVFAADALRGSLQKRVATATVIAVFCGVSYYYFFVGDWLYAIPLLRRAVIAGTFVSVCFMIGLQQAKYVLFFLLLVIASRFFLAASFRQRVVFSLSIALLASNIALAFIHRSAPYAVNFSYGAEGQIQMQQLLSRMPSLPVHTSVEGGFARGYERFIIFSPEEWDSSESLLRYLVKNNPPCLIYGEAVNTVRQLTSVLNDPEIKRYLEKEYYQVAIGSYRILLRANGWQAQIRR